MDNETQSVSGRRAARMSKRRKQRMIILGVAAAVILALLIWAIVFVVDMFTAPEAKQPQRPDSSANSDDPNPPNIPDRNDDPNGGNEGNGNGDGGKDNPGDKTDVDPNKLKDNFYTFLIAGTADNYNTDTIMLGAVNTKTLECNVISIPRDSMYDTTAKIKRINGSYGRGGIDNLREAVRSVTGVYPQYYCVVNMESFIEVVDAIGGVEFDVPMDMYHPDLNPDYHIDLKKGFQKLDGKKALQLVRFRSYKLSDFERINMQKKFLVTVLQTVKSKFGLKNAPGIISTVADSIKTNMPVADMVWFYNNVISKMDLANDITFHTLPYSGTGKYKGQDYVYIDEAKALELLNQTVNPFATPLTSNDVNIICLKDEDY